MGLDFSPQKRFLIPNHCSKPDICKLWWALKTRSKVVKDANLALEAVKDGEGSFESKNHLGGQKPESILLKNPYC